MIPALLAVAHAAPPVVTFGQYVDPNIGQDGANFKRIGGAWADVDDDGDWDVWIPAGDGARLLLFDPALPGFTDGTGAMTGISGLSAPVTGLLAADLDHDGNVDLAATTLGSVSVWLGDDGVYGAPVSVTAVTGVVGIGLVDFDDDGWLDIVAPADDATQVLRNDLATSGGFVSVPTDGPSAAVDYLTVTDLDGDGVHEVYVRADNGAVAWEATGGGLVALAPQPTFTSRTGANDQGAVAACDVDRDGALELLWTEEDAVHQTGFWEPTSGGWAQVPDTLFTTSDYVLAAVCADLDNDGWPDVYAADRQVDVLRLQDGLGGWISTDQIAQPTTGATGADFDEDGDIDILTVDRDTNNILLVNHLAAAADANHLQVRLELPVGSCPDRRTRDDVGARATLWDAAHASAVVAEVSGGLGRGTTGWPVLHFGVPDPDQQRTLDVRFTDAAVGDYSVDVVPEQVRIGGVNRLVLAADDRDGDTVLDPDDPGPTDLDADDDGWLDALEAGRSDPCLPPEDFDGDGLPDLEDLDSEDDGLSDADELAAGTDRHAEDSDGGGVDDLLEFDCTDPTNAADDEQDNDGDGLIGTIDPRDCDVDTDDDGLLDGPEVQGTTDPTEPDYDGDGVQDGTELGVTVASPDTATTFIADVDPTTKTDPADEDFDDDGLVDGAEDLNFNGKFEPDLFETDPANPDTDGGGVWDGDERAVGGDPNDPSDDDGLNAPPRSGSTDPAAPIGCGCAGSPWGGAWPVLVLVAVARRGRATPRRRADARSGPSRRSDRGS